MPRNSRTLAGIVAFALSPQASALDIVSGSSFANLTEVYAGYEEVPGTFGTIGSDEIYSYWDQNPGVPLQIFGQSTFDVYSDIDLAYGGGHALHLEGATDPIIRIYSTFSGSAISGEGGGLRLGADFFDSSTSAVFLEPYGLSAGSIIDVDRVSMNADVLRLNEGSEIMLGEGDSLSVYRRWLDLSTSTPYSRETTVFNAGIIDQAGNNSSVDIDGLLAVDGSWGDGNGTYRLQGGTLSASEIQLLDGATFEQSAGTSNSVERGVWILDGSSYTMFGGNLRAESVSGNFIYHDGGVRVTNQDIAIETGGLLGAQVTMDDGEVFGATNMTVGNANPGSGSVVMEGGLNFIDNDYSVAAGGTVTQNGGYNSIDNNMTVDGGTWTQNGGSGRVSGTITLAGGGTYTMNGGQLTAGNISEVIDGVNDNRFDYVNGGVRLTAGDINVAAGGLLGENLLIDEPETFGAVNMTVGTSNTDSGSITQSTGQNLVLGQLRIDAGGRYDLSGGVLEFASFAGPGTINFTGGGVYVTADLTMGPAGPFGPSLLLDDTRTLALTGADLWRHSQRHDLTLASGADITLDGGDLVANRIIANGNFSFVSGLLDVNQLTIGDTGLLGSTTLTNGKTLYVRDALTIANGHTLTIEGSGVYGNGIITNNGSLVLDGGSLDASRLDNQAGSSFDFVRGSLGLDSLDIADTGLLGNTVILNSNRTVNASTVTVASNGRLEVNGGVSGASSLNNAGEVVIAAGARLNGSSFEQHVAGAHTTVDGTLDADVVVSAGIFEGSGRVGGLTLDGGTLNPGNSPGLLSVLGDYTQSGSATLVAEIGGLLPGDEYDVLDVGGVASLAGTLDVNLFDLGSGLFTPGVGDTFDILMAETIVGEFDTLELAALGSGLSWSLSYLTDALGTTDLVRLSVVASVATVPVPAAVWLFGSGLFGLIGIARKKRVA